MHVRRFIAFEVTQVIRDSDVLEPSVRFRFPKGKASLGVSRMASCLTTLIQ